MPIKKATSGEVNKVIFEICLIFESNSAMQKGCNYILLQYVVTTVLHESQEMLISETMIEDTLQRVDNATIEQEGSTIVTEKEAGQTGNEKNTPLVRVALTPGFDPSKCFYHLPHFLKLIDASAADRRSLKLCLAKGEIALYEKKT